MLELQHANTSIKTGSFSRHTYFFTLFFLLPIFGTFAQAPTSPSTNFSVSNIDGDRFYVSFTKGDGEKRIIIASESPVTASPVNGVDYVPGNFGLGNELEPGEFVVYDGTAGGTWLYGFDPATTYYLKIVEYNGVDFSTQYLISDYLTGEATTISGPTIQASGLSFSNVTGNSMTLSWTGGDGWGRIVLAKVDAPVDAEPVDGINYSGSSSFGSGSQLGTGNYAVYSGTGNSVSLSNLDPNRTYHFEVFEYSGNNGRVYLRPGSNGSQLTLSEPSTPASNFYTSNVDGNRFYYGMTTGNGTRRIVIARSGSAVSFSPVDGQEYTHSTTFGSGQEVAPGEFVVYNGSSSGSWLYGLVAETTYHFSVFEYNGTGSEIDYLQDPYLTASQSTISGPTVQASGLNFSNVTGNSMTLSWTSGDGWGRLVLAKLEAPVDAVPIDGVNYSGSSSFGSGSQLGSGNFAVYSGTGNSVNLSNLDPNATYHFEIFEYSGNNGRIYLKPGPTANQQTESAPTAPSSNFYTSNVDGNRFYYGMTTGNGTRRIVIARSGSAVSFSPVDGQEYTHSTTFGSGQEVAPGEFVVYNGTSSGSWLYGLDAETTYHFSVFEYNGTGSETDYLQDPYLTASQSTISGPTVQASGLNFSNVTGNSMTLSWTGGDGWGRLVLAKEDFPVDAQPMDGTNYAASSSFGSGSQLEIGNYAVYSGTGNSVNLSNLNPNKTYHFEVFEYSGNNGRIYLKPGPTANQQTASAPTVPASNFYTSNVDGDRFYYGFTRGNGTKRVVIAKAGSPVSFTPEDGQTYSGSATFGSGQEVSLDEFVVYEGTSSGSWLYGLSPGTEYHFAIFEHNGDGQYYLIDPYLEAIQATLGTPTVQSSSAFTSSRSNTSIDISWTKGNGSNRILLGRKDGPVNVEPSDLSSYNSSSVFGQREIGTGNYVLYSSSGNAVNITNLEPGTNYHFALFEYNGSSAKMYLRPGYQFSLETFGERPTIQSSNASFSQVTNDSFTVDFTKGNGSGRIVLAKAGSPVDAGPSDFTSYNSNGHFAWGDEIGNGNFVIYQGSEETFLLEGLSPGTVYYLAFFEYAMSVSGELYLAPAYTSSQETLTPIDLALTALINPLSDCELSSGEEVQVEISNLTEYPVDYIKLSYSINGGDPVIEELSQNDLIPANGTYTYTFNQVADLSIDQVYQFEVNLLVEGDLDASNDFLQLEIENFPDLVTSITPNSSINQGESILLEAGGGISYLWSTGESSAQITVQPTETTTYTVVITGENGCQVERSVVVDVIPDPCYNVTCPPGYTCYEGYCFATFVTVTGTVRDADTSAPLENVIVRNGAIIVYTASDGTYSIEAQVLTDLNFELTGYQSQSFEIPDESAPIIDMDLVNPCFNSTCPDGFVCYQGSCYPEEDPCLGITCPIGYSCYEGACYVTIVTVTGTVRDADTGLPLVDAKVISDTETVYTSLTGTYNIEAQVLTELRFEFDGYESQSIEVPDEGAPVIDADLLANPCYNVICPDGYVCYEGACYPEEDPCAGVICPDGFSCYEGACYPIVMTVTGTVRDADSLDPLQGVAVGDGFTTVYTAPDGTYSIETQVLGQLIFSLSSYNSKTVQVPNESNPIIDVDLISLCSGVVCPDGYSCYEGACYPPACQSEFGNLEISPSIGNGDTEFTFSIDYTDPDGISLSLGYPHLVLEETNSSGTFETSYILEELDPSDENLTDGKVYQLVITGLNPTSTYRAKVEASNQIACNISTDWTEGPALIDSDIDLGIFANNISFSNENPNAFEPITIFARIRNYSDLPAENIEVTAYDGETQIFSTVIGNIQGNATMDLSWPYSFEEPGFYPIKVVIDEPNQIEEINELNNFAIRPVLVGDYVLPGGMSVEASLNTNTVYPGQYVTLTGLAQYFGIDPGVNPDVAGASVEIQWTNGVATSTTRADGSFSRSFRMPTTPGIYTFSGQVTDYTLTGEFAPMEVEVIPYPNKPDLTASVELDQAQIIQGETISGRAILTNTGDATAYNFLFQWRNCEIQLGEEMIESLAPGESISFEFSASPISTGSCFNLNNCSFQAFADPTNQVDEKSKYNNNGIRYLTVYPDAPDLVVSQSYAPSSSRMESPTQVNVRVDNIGGVSISEAFVVNTYVDGNLVDTRDFAGLITCEKINYTLDLDFASLEDHLIEIKVDEPLGSGFIQESNESNNSYSKLIRYIAPPILYPNLNVRIQDLKVNPISPQENQEFEISAIFRNNGAAPISEDIPIRWIITEAGSETIIDDIWAGGLGVEATASVAIPASINSFGNHSVRLIIDPENLFQETYESDNLVSMPLCTDLEAVQTGGVWYGGFFVNTPQYLTVKVKNKGLFEANNVQVVFKLDGVQIAETSLPSVPPSYSGSGVPVSIPYVFTESGTFILEVVIDEANDWIECNEGNNAWSKSITVKGPQPDLRILSEFISPTELNPDPDEQVQIFLSFENIGVVDAGPFKLRLLMDEKALGQDISVGGLGAGKISTIAIPTPYSSPTAGIKVMKGQVDPDQLANDVNYKNNEATRALVVGTAPNLYFENISFSYLCPEIGDEISIGVDIFNEGDLASNAELEFAYITDNDTIPIETKAIFVDLQSGISESIQWSVVNPDYPILARIKNSDPQEFNGLDNWILGEIRDSIPPTLITQNLELFLDNSGFVNLVAEDFDNGSFDEGCGIESMTLNQNSLDCSVLDTWIPLQFTATDLAGNSSSQEVLVMVRDNILPSIENMPASIEVGNDPGNCTAIVSWIEPLALDNCSGADIQQITGLPNGSAFGLGEHLILYQAVDASGNTIQDGFTITVSDTEAPSLIAPANITIGTDTGLCEASNVDLGEAQSGDNCGGVQVTNDAPAIFPLGLTFVNWRAEDAAGNIRTATQEVLVQDTEAPSLVAPANIIVGTDAGLCEASNVNLGEAQSGDNCGGVQVSNDAPAIFPLGLTIVNWRAEDAAGNVTTATQEVLVQDNEAPSFVAPANIVVGNDPGTCTAIVSWIEPIPFDNCSGASIQQITGLPNGSAFGLGEHLIVYQAVDASGNTIQDGFTITVSDTETPSLVAPANITIGTDVGLCEASNVDLGEAQSGDNCGGVQVTNDAPTIFPLGLTIVNWRAEDAAGNVSTATQEVLVQDNEVPSLVAPANIVVGTDAGLCEASNVDLGEAQSGDNCGGVQVSNDAPAIFPLGLTIVTWRAEDAAGNIRTATQEVLVQDTEAPSFVAPANIVVGNDPGTCTAIVSWIEPIAFDNCSGASIQQITGLPNGSAFGLGEHLIVYQAVDASGNTIQDGFTITVSDTETPSLVAPPNITIGTDVGLCEASNVDLGEAQSGDNCGGVQVTNDAPAIFPLGLTIVNWRAEDAAGNVTTATQEVLVQDTEAPSLVAPANIIVGTDAGICEASNVDLGEAQSGDNCGGVQVTNDAPAIFPLGLTIVNWRAEDAGGNVNTAIQEVLVQDTEAPSLVAPTNIIVGTDAGLCEASNVNLGEAQSGDNCGGVQVTNDAPAIFPLGLTIVNWRAEDAAGNVSTTTQEVLVQDTEAPTVLTQNITLTIQEGEQIEVLPESIDAGSSDNCGSLTLSLDKTLFTDLDEGETLVTLTASDEAGNSASNTAVVTIVVNRTPTCEIIALATDISIELDRKGQASLSSREIDNGSSSTCGRIVEENLSQSTFTCSDVGENLVLYTVIDTEGNQAETLIIVTVIDPEAPAISRTPKSITEAFTDGQIFEIPDYRISYPATDNCSVAEFIQFPSPGTTLDAQGTYPITLTARDTYGNEVQTSFDLILSSSGGKGRGKNKFVRNESLISVPWNTPSKEISLIGYERDENGQKEELSVEWELSSYNGLVSGIYEFKGLVIEEEAPSKDSVLMWVLVKEKSMPEDILISDKDLEEILKPGLTLGTFETIDLEDDQHTYEIVDSEELGIKENQLIWIGKEQKASYPITFRVRSTDRAGQSIERDMILERGFDKANFEMYPNPASDFVQLQINLTGPSHVSIQVFDLGGKLLIKEEGEYETGFQKSLEVRSLAAGTYLVQVQINFQIEMKRLIIKK